MLAVLFGHMLRIADPARMEGWPGDLLRDAVFLNAQLDTEPLDKTRIWFQPYDCGTNIGIVDGATCGFPLDVLRRGNPGRAWWWITLTSKPERHASGPRASWSATFTLCEPIDGRDFLE